MNPHQIPFKSKTKQNILDQHILDQTRPYIHLSHPSKSLEKVTILGLHLRRHGSAEVLIASFLTSIRYEVSGIVADLLLTEEETHLAYGLVSLGALGVKIDRTYL